MYVQYRNYNSSNSSCIMATRISMNSSTHEAEYRTRWYNLTAAAPRQIKSLYKTHNEILTATQCYPGGGNSTNNYTITYTDSLCAVVIIPHWKHAAVNCPDACEMWVRDDSVNTWNTLCDQQYEEHCGKRKTKVYDKKYCDAIMDYFQDKNTEIRTQ
nr:uncharacterized protein LOC129387506 [Dermacentor andersoni]